jgi:hypothetical protein
MQSGQPNRTRGDPSLVDWSEKLGVGCIGDAARPRLAYPPSVTRNNAARQKSIFRHKNASERSFRMEFRHEAEAGAMSVSNVVTRLSPWGQTGAIPSRLALFARPARPAHGLNPPGKGSPLGVTRFAAYHCQLQRRGNPPLASISTPQVDDANF